MQGLARNKFQASCETRGLRVGGLEVTRGAGLGERGCQRLKILHLKSKAPYSTFLSFGSVC